MKVDAHHHLWQYDPHQYGWINEEMQVLRQSFLSAEWDAVGKDAGITASIVVQARQSTTENDFLLRQAERSQRIQGIVGWVDLINAKEREAQLAHYSQYESIKGYRHVLQDEPDDRFMLQAAFIEGLRMLHRQGLTYDILVFEKQLTHVPTLLDQVSVPLPCVVDHLGKPLIRPEGPTKEWKESIKTLASFPHVSVKLSGLVTEAPEFQWKPDDFLPYLDWAWECFGPERLMMGSDWPVCLLAAKDYAQVLQLVDDFLGQFSEADQQKVKSANALRFYRLT